MNANKKNNGWILCPSQSFPGKFYYFNVINGEAAWTLNEAEKKDVKQDTSIPKIVDKSHCYPEPDSPPIDESPNTSSLFPNYKKPEFDNVGSKLTNNKVTNATRPVFGQAVFPTYVSNVNSYVPNIIWTPLQIPTSMYIGPEVRKQTSDQVTQTVAVDAHVLVQSCTVPLNKRFINYEKPILNFNKDNKIENKCDFPKLCSSTPTKCTRQILDCSGTNNLGSNYSRQINSNQGNDEVNRKPFIKEPIMNKVSHSDYKTLECMNPTRSLSELFTKQLKNFRNSKGGNNENVHQEYTNFSVNNFKKLDQKHLYSDNYYTQELNGVSNHAETTVKYCGTQNIESERGQTIYDSIKSTSLDQDFKKLHVKAVNPNKSTKHEDIESKETAKIEESDVTELGRHDLRLLLVARKRKLSETDNQPGYSEEKKLKAMYTKDTKSATPKKRVTFNLGNQFEDYDEQNETFASTSKLTSTQMERSPVFQTLRDVAEYPVMDCWYIVPDTDVLLDDYEFIEGLVKSDDNCRLLIPHAVHSDIVALTSGDSRGRQRVYVARQIARRIALRPLHVMVQPAEREDIANMFTIDSILDCCLKAMQQKYQLVLITNDVELHTKAKALDIQCYNMHEVRNASSSCNPEVTFDLKKIQITVKNDPKVTESNLFLQNDFKPYSNGTSYQVPVNSVKQRLFEDILNEKSDKLIDITRPKHSNNMQPNKTCPFDYENDNIETSNEIGRDIKRFNIWDNKTVKPYRETRDANQNITYDEDDLFDFNNVALDSDVFDRHKQMTNSNTNQGFHSENAFENKIKVPNSKIEKLQPKGDVTSLFFQNRLEQTTFDRQNLNRYDFLKIIPNSNNEYGNVLNQPKANANGANFKHLNELSMDNKLKRFHVKDRETEERIVTRIDEWVCCFTQIMEDTLSIVLQNQALCGLSPPWTIYEAMQCIKKKFNDSKEVCIIIDAFTELTSGHRCDQGNIKPSMKPNDFMKIIGCCVLLMQALKSVIRNHQLLTEAEISLNNIIQLLENPSLDPKLPQCSLVLSRFDKSLEGEPRHNFIKDPTDIIKYLKKHYIQWISYDVDTDDNNYLKKYKQYQSKCIENANIVRTFGKNLGLLKIDKCKIMTMDQQTDDEPRATRLLETVTRIIDDKTDGPVVNTQKYPTTGPRVLRILENLRSQEQTKDMEKKPNTLDLGKYGSTYQKQTKTEPKVIIRLDNIKEFNFKQTKDKSIPLPEDLNVSKRENTFKQSDVTNGPKIVRNIKLIDAFEKRLKSKPAELDLDILDYSDIDKDDISEAITNQSASGDTANLISELNISNITESNLEMDKPVHEDSGFNNNNYSDSNKVDSTCNKNDSRHNNVESHRRNTSYYTNNDKIICDAKLNDKFTPSSRDGKHSGHDLKRQNNGQYSISNNVNIIIDDQVDDSGIESESVCAYPLAKTFLIDLSNSLKMIHHFIETSVTDIRSKDFGDEKKSKLHSKAKKTHQCVNEIIYNLKSIIRREASGGTTLKDLLVKAGVQVTTDKRMSKYRQIVRKCLEQAQILQNVLKIMLSMTDTDFEATSVTTESISSSIRFLNIFE